MSSEALESVFLENVLPELEAEGFDVFANPSRRLLPPFMRGHSPDAIALRKDKKLAIEVLREGAPSDPRLGELRELISNHKDWELRVYWIRPSNSSKPIEITSRQSIDQSIKAVEDLAVSGHTRPALLMGWATLEAIGRAMLPERFEKPQTPGRLIEVLATEGHITPNEADHVRRLVDDRNRLVHGALDMSVSEADLKQFIEVLKTLYKVI
jgi:REase_AHJR-like